MFEGRDNPKSLDEEVFDGWLEQGRQSKIGYEYLLVIWDAFEVGYRPVYTADREDIARYQEDGHNTRERLIAAYHLYSESRIV